MNTETQLRMLNALYACLLPIAKLLLRSGITYSQFDLVAKRAFVHQAMSEANSQKRPTNDSRIAVSTGLSRKEVKKTREAFETAMREMSGTFADRLGPLARVLHAWHFDQRFLDEHGRPRDLDLQDEANGFNALVRAVAGDVPFGAVRAELKRAGAVIELDDGKVRAIKRHYVPGNVDDRAIAVMSGMLFPMTAGVAHNADPTRTTDGFFQRFAYSERMDQPAINEFRAWSRQRATQFIESMDDWIARHEQAADSTGSIRKRTAGIGVFFYEGPNAEDAIRRSLPETFEET